MTDKPDKIVKVVGQRIVSIRYQTIKEMEYEGWDKPALVLVLENGTKLFASQDSEGNGPGIIFGSDRQGDGFYLHVPKG